MFWVKDREVDETSRVPRDSKNSNGRQTKGWGDDMKNIAGLESIRIEKSRTERKPLEEAFVEGQAEKDELAADENMFNIVKV